MSAITTINPWKFLSEFTDARIALGRAGNSIPTNELLKFQLAHAQAKDAVYSIINTDRLKSEISELGLETLLLHSKASNRAEYLKRPDLGRKLNENSLSEIGKATIQSSGSNLSICAVDGLSSEAIHTNLIPFLKTFLPLIASEKLTLAPIALVQQGRVAIGDEICHALNAEIAIVLIGERPGLSSPDSMGIYLTYKPLPGFTDESRNCISNIRPKGLTYESASNALYSLIKASRALKLSGVRLKEDKLLEI